MDHLVAVTTELGGNHVTIFEVDPANESGLELASSRVGKTAHAQISFAEALDGIRPAVQRLTELVNSLAPDEAEIEFGLKVGGETGIIVAKGTTEANFALKMTWKRSRSDAVDSA